MSNGNRIQLGKRRALQDLATEQSSNRAKRIHTGPAGAWTGASHSAVHPLTCDRNDVYTHTTPLPPPSVYSPSWQANVPAIHVQPVVSDANPGLVRQHALWTSQPACIKENLDPRVRHGAVRPRVPELFKIVYYNEASNTARPAPTCPPRDLQLDSQFTQDSAVSAPLEAPSFEHPEPARFSTISGSTRPRTSLPLFLPESPLKDNSPHMYYPSTVSSAPQQHQALRSGLPPRPYPLVEPPYGLTLALVKALRSGPLVHIIAEGVGLLLEKALMAELGLCDLGQYRSEHSFKLHLALNRILHHHESFTPRVRLRLHLAWDIVAASFVACAPQESTASALDQVRNFFFIAPLRPPNGDIRNVHEIFALIYTIVHVAALSPVVLDRCAERLSGPRQIQMPTYMAQVSDEHPHVASRLSQRQKIEYQHVSNFFKAAREAVRDEQVSVSAQATVHANHFVTNVCVDVDRIVRSLITTLQDKNMEARVDELWKHMRVALEEGFPKRTDANASKLTSVTPLSFVPPLTESEIPIIIDNLPRGGTYVLVRRFLDACGLPVSLQEWSATALLDPVDIVLQVLLDAAVSSLAVPLADPLDQLRKANKASYINATAVEVPGIVDTTITNPSMNAPQQHMTKPIKLSPTPKPLSHSFRPVHSHGSLVKRSSSPAKHASSPVKHADSSAKHTSSLVKHTCTPAKHASSPAKHDSPPEEQPVASLNPWLFSRLTVAQRQAVVSRWVASQKMPQRRNALASVMMGCSDATVLSDPVQLIARTSYSKTWKNKLKAEWWQWLQEGGTGQKEEEGHGKEEGSGQEAEGLPRAESSKGKKTQSLLQDDKDVHRIRLSRAGKTHPKAAQDTSNASQAIKAEKVNKTDTAAASYKTSETLAMLEDDTEETPKPSKVKARSKRIIESDGDDETTLKPFEKRGEGPSMGGTGTALPIVPAEFNPELAESGDLEENSRRPGLVSGLQGIDPNIDPSLDWSVSSDDEAFGVDEDFGKMSV